MGLIFLIDVVFLAAGTGKRLGLGFPKQFAMLGGKPIMIHSLEVLQAMEEICKIIVVTVPGTVVDVVEMLLKYDITKTNVIEGDSTRQESVFRGLNECHTDRVIIHEAVRPFVTETLIRLTLSHETMPAVVPVVPVSQTVVSRDDKYYIERDLLRNVQLPQVFNRRLLLNAHQAAGTTIYPDDTTLMQDITGISPFMVEGLEENIKITTPIDLVIAEAIYNEYYINRNRR
jgi:2-C-methyl-D-erythritol 4-phosphate cytidylyltransferase